MSVEFDSSIPSTEEPHDNFNEELTSFTPQQFRKSFQHLVPDWHTFEDLFQEARLIALNKREKFDSSKNIFPWFRKVFHNVIIDFIRAKKKNPIGRYTDLEILQNTGMRVDTYTSQPNEVDSDCILSEIETLDSLSDNQRHIVELRILGSYSVEEIAKVMGSNKKCVRKNLDRARDKMRLLLGPRKIAG